MTEFSVRMADSDQAALLIKLISSMESVEEITVTEESDDIELSESTQFHIDPERQQMLKEEAAFKKMLPDLLPNYLDEYVAVYRQQLVDHDQDMVTLVDRVHAKYPNAVIMVKQVSTTPEQPLYFRSPRLVR